MHEIARWLIWGEAFDAILNSYYNCCYYIIRSGGKTVTTFLFDSGFIWGVSVVAAMIIAYRTSIAIVPFTGSRERWTSSSASSSSFL